VLVIKINHIRKIGVTLFFHGFIPEFGLRTDKKPAPYQAGTKHTVVLAFLRHTSSHIPAVQILQSLSICILKNPR
jgi:hypothetical protein